MKNTIVILLILLLCSSCGSTKRAAKKTSTNTTTNVIINEKTPIITETKIKPTTPNPAPVTKPTTTETVDQTPTKILSVKEKISSKEVFNHNAWNTLLQQYVTNKGNVNYKGFKSNRKAITDYIQSLGEKMPNNTWSKDEKIAYWINAYNAMTVDLIIRNYPLNSIKDIKDPWKQRLWKLGSRWYNLDEIEHQILRKMNEPRIHFGIVCASFSCPKLINKAFTSTNLENQLTNATKDFLKDPERNDISSNSIKLSKIFKWFTKDFKTEGSLIDFLNKYSDIIISKNAKKSFKDYNWSLNN